MFTREEVNAMLFERIPSNMVSSAVQIVGAKNGRFGALATGVLFQVADTKFVVTAGHVVHQAREKSLTVGMSCDNKGFLVFYRDFTVLDPNNFLNFEDVVDIAIYELSKEEIFSLSESTFLLPSDVANVPENGICTIFGFPGILSTSPTNDSELLNVKALQLTVPVHSSETANLPRFNTRYSFLLDGNPEYSSALDGSAQNMSHLSKRATESMLDFKGLSGGPVWCIATTGTDPKEWPQTSPKLVGLQVAVYPHSDLLVVTRWACILDLICMVRPDLIPKLNVKL